MVKLWGFTLAAIIGASLFSIVEPPRSWAAAGQPPPIRKDFTPRDRAAYLQDISVTIHAKSSQGSGVIMTRGGVNYVWTAAHVVSRLRHTRKVIDSKSGLEKTLVEFDDAKVVKELVEAGRTVGRLEMDAEVLRYSDADNGEDLALLRIRKKNFVNASVSFYLKNEIPDIGTELYHCGSLLGQVGSNSMTRGIMSQQGRVLYGKVYDQTTCAAFPGSSGGGVYLPNGKFVGMIVRGAGETFNLIVPVRRIHIWAKKVGTEFAIDDTVRVPTEDQLWQRNIEDVTTNRAPFAAAPWAKDLKFMIYDSEEKTPSLRLKLELDRK